MGRGSGHLPAHASAGAQTRERELSYEDRQRLWRGARAGRRRRLCPPGSRVMLEIARLPLLDDRLIDYEGREGTVTRIRADGTAVVAFDDGTTLPVAVHDDLKVLARGARTARPVRPSRDSVAALMSRRRGFVPPPPDSPRVPVPEQLDDQARAMIARHCESTQRMDLAYALYIGERTLSPALADALTDACRELGITLS